MHFSVSANQIKHAIASANSILIVSHRQPDADALGSIAALARWLRARGKTLTAFCAEWTRAPQHDFLVADIPFCTPTNIPVDIDLVIVLDTGDLPRSGLADWLGRQSVRPSIINIDHHATNTRFGAMNWVDAEAASTTLMLYRLFREWGVSISTDMAEALLAGIVGDTYNFTNSNTSAEVLQVTGALVREGAHLSAVSQRILQSKPLPAMRVWGGVLARLSVNKEFGVATAIITAEDMAPLLDPNRPEELPTPEAVEGIANFLNSLSGVRMAIVLRELPAGQIKGSLRTNDELIDVSKLATLLGGGGHKKAAGFTINGRLEQIGGKWQIVYNPKL